jgi:hypothetical protein
MVEFVPKSVKIGANALLVIEADIAKNVIFN